MSDIHDEAEQLARSDERCSRCHTWVAGSTLVTPRGFQGRLCPDCWDPKKGLTGAPEVEHIDLMGLPANDPVNHPSHYTSQVPDIECIEVTRHFNFNRGNAIKYIWRAGAKGDIIVDLRKAIWYLIDEIQFLEGNDGESD